MLTASIGLETGESEETSQVNHSTLHVRLSADKRIREPIIQTDGMFKDVVENYAYMYLQKRAIERGEVGGKGYRFCPF